MIQREFSIKSSNLKKVFNEKSTEADSWESYSLSIFKQNVLCDPLFTKIQHHFTILCIFFSYPKALELVASGQVNVKPLVTHRFSLEESHKAFVTAKTCAEPTIKVMIKCSPE